MGCDTYTVLVGDVVAGKGMAIGYALVFAKALFSEFWNDPDISITIKKEAQAAAEQEVAR